MFEGFEALPLPHSLTLQSFQSFSYGYIYIYIFEITTFITDINRHLSHPVTQKSKIVEFRTLFGRTPAPKKQKIQDHRVYVWHRRHGRLVRRLCGVLVAIGCNALIRFPFTGSHAS